MAVTASWCIKFTFRDSKGQTRSITLCYESEEATSGVVASDLFSAAGTTVGLLQACSNAHVQCEYAALLGGTGQSGVTYGTAAAYQSVATQARLYFLTSDPSGDPSPTATVTIPAPKSSIFLADGVTVDPANANVTALANELIAVSVPITGGVAGITRSGLAFTSFVGGILVGKKLSRKFNKYTFNPELTVRGI